MFFSFFKQPYIKLLISYLLLILLCFALGFLSSESQMVVSSSTDSWGLSFPVPGEKPIGNATSEELKKYNAYFMCNTSDKKLYLTFDAGYENGNTKPILKTLKKYNISATFFVVGTYISQNPELILQMIRDGHTIGNHTMTHPDMSAITDHNHFEQELSSVEKLYKNLTGNNMIKFYRPPRGIFNLKNLSMAEAMGYSTFFWSLAYVDWDPKKQPTSEEAFEKLLKRIHPGAIILLHNTSSTNAAILDTLILKWKEMGYSFGTLQEFI